MYHLKIYNNWTHYVSNYKIDHIAYRSFDKSILVNHLMNKGYKLQNDNYHFVRHNASATWLQNKNDIIPRIFISQYNDIYNDIHLLKSDVDIEKIDYHIKNEHKLLSYTFYNEIHKVNQYLAWTLVFRHNVENHLAMKL